MEIRLVAIGSVIKSSLSMLAATIFAPSGGCITLALGAVSPISQSRSRTLSHDVKHQDHGPWITACHLTGV
ncbi:hypothetical protein BDV09DRAFT_173712 [Aspergillus tetrazonus]